MTDEFQLTEGERSHPLWMRLKSHLQDRLAAARLQNDHLSNGEPDTAAQRGKIACLKSIIGLGDDRPQV
jgi:hypothetical protein